MSTALIIAPSADLLPAKLYAPTPQAAKRVLEFFTAQINNDHTRRAYLNTTKRFADWCGKHGLRDLVDVEPIHVAGRPPRDGCLRSLRTENLPDRFNRGACRAD